MMALPVRWTAPEAFFSGKYSEKTDVWAYSIVLLEIWQDGDTPYPELKNEEVRAWLACFGLFLYFWTTVA